MMDRPTISVIVTTHEWVGFRDFADTLRSVKRQTYEAIELVCPIGEDADLAAATRAIAGDDVVSYVPRDEHMSTARNRGAAVASGDVYAFLDADAVATPEWAASLARAYRNDELAVGGPAIPEWPAGGRPRWLPRDWDWLVGCGPYYDAPRAVRNTYGCNLSMVAGTFDSLGGFEEQLGKGARIGQSEETELCRRLNDQYGRRVRYCPDARVRHRVTRDQLRVRALVRRAYEQGVAKRAIGIGDGETEFIKRTVPKTLMNPAAAAYTVATGLGYLLGSRWSP